MTPELAQKISEKPVNTELLMIMHDVYQRFTVQELSDVIAKIRAEIVLANLGAEISK